MTESSSRSGRALSNLPDVVDEWAQAVVDREGPLAISLLVPFVDIEVDVEKQTPRDDACRPGVERVDHVRIIIAHWNV